jgi:Na+-driven multidrug efflux pump
VSPAPVEHLVGHALAGAIKDKARRLGFASAMIFGGALRGAGDTLNVMRITLASTFGLRLLGVLIVGAYFKMGVAVIWIVLCCELTIRGGLIFAHFLRGKWKHVEV